MHRTFKNTAIYFLLLTVLLTACSGRISEVDSNAQTQSGDITERLMTGNSEFLSENKNTSDWSAELRKQLAEKGEKPYAIVVCCSDSRVPPEHIFNAGLGELYVVRTLGNVLDEVSLGSVEYGASQLGIPLIIVLGHTDCGIVSAAINGGVQGSIKAVTAKIAPALEKARLDAAMNNTLAERTEDYNILNTIEEIKASPVISPLINSAKLNITGAKYDTKTGEIMFF